MKTLAHGAVAAALLIVPLLAGCGSDSTKVVSDPDPAPPPPSTVAEVMTAVIDGNGAAIQQAVRDGITPTATVQTWDGEDLVVEIATDVVLSTATDSLGTPPAASESPTRGAGYQWKTTRIGRIADDSATISRLSVDWNSADLNDYLAGGYWLTVNSPQMGNQAVEVGAFIDGPDFDTTPTLPVSGSATYEGRVHGLHTVQYVPGEFGRTAREFSIGEFDGDVALTADFANSMIDGRIDNIYSTEESSTVMRPRSTRPYVISLGQAPIDGNGGFTGAVSVSTPSNNVASSEGSWNGQFSGTPMGDPRVIGGTFGATWVHTGGTTGQYVGTFYAGKN